MAVQEEGQVEREEKDYDGRKVEEKQTPNYQTMTDTEGNEVREREREREGERERERERDDMLGF